MPSAHLSFSETFGFLTSTDTLAAAHSEQGRTGDTCDRGSLLRQWPLRQRLRYEEEGSLKGLEWRF